LTKNTNRKKNLKLEENKLNQRQMKQRLRREAYLNL